MVNYKKTGKVKENIKTVAHSLFAVSGYDNVKVEEIAKEAGVAKGLIFYHFTSKEGLLSEIIQDEAKGAFKMLSSFVDGLPPDIAVLKLFQGMFTTTKSIKIADGFFDGDLPEKYHYAVDKARMETIIPLLHDLIKSGYEQDLFYLEEVDISYIIVSMGFNSYLTTHFHLFVDSEYHKSFLKSAAYILNSTLNPTRITFEFQIREEQSPDEILAKITDDSN